MKDETQLARMAFKLASEYPFDAIPAELYAGLTLDDLRENARKTLRAVVARAMGGFDYHAGHVTEIGDLFAAVVKWALLVDHAFPENRRKTLIKMELAFVPRCYCSYLKEYKEGDQ